MKIENIKEGQELYRFGLSKFGGRIWSFDRNIIRIIKMNNLSVRINKSNINNDLGNSFTMNNLKFEHYLKSCFETKEEAWKLATKSLKRWSEEATEVLKGYTKLHEHYYWFVYTKDILTEFYNLLKNGFTEEKYYTIKLKYKVIEDKLIKEIFM